MTCTDPISATRPYVVAAKIEKHQMLGALFRVIQQLVGKCLIFLTRLATRGRVPAIGRIVTSPARARTRISGLDPTTEKPSRLRKNRNGEGLTRRSAR